MTPDIGAIPGLKQLWAETLGHSDICLAVLDGPVDQMHPGLKSAQLTRLDTLVTKSGNRGPAAQHGTHVTSVIFGQHGGPVKGIAPNCRGLIVPIFSDGDEGSIAPCSQIDLARAITQAVQAGAQIINISGGEFSFSGTAHPILTQAIQSCAEQDVLIIAAAGNEGCDCLHVPGALPSVLAVGAMDGQNRPLDSSNWGQVYRHQGILAPGEHILGALPGGGTRRESGTSYATAVVSGVAALLLSLQRQLGQQPDPQAVRKALLESTHACDEQMALDCRPFLVGSLNIPGAHTAVVKRIPEMKVNGQSITNDSAGVHAQTGFPAAQTGVKVGEMAPDFLVKDHTGRPVRLSDYRGQTVVLWFYPKADTPGCTMQGTGFRDRIRQFEAMNAQVLGISMDSVAANAAFAEKYQFPFPLLSDIDGQVCRAYGVYSEDRKIKRSTFVIRPDGTIQHTFVDVEPEGHVEMVMDSLKEAEMNVMSPGYRTSQIRSRGKVSSLKKGEQTRMDDQKYVENAPSCQCQAGNMDQSGIGLEIQSGAELERLVSPASVSSGVAEATAVWPSQVQAAKASGGPQLVFALGTLGHDFGTEARRDSIAQHMATPENPIPNPHDPPQWLDYLETNPDQAASVTWTLTLDTTPIYAVLPRGPFAAPVYERLRQFLGEQVSEGVERVSVAGVIIGQVRLMSGQIVPVIWPELRCMYSWTTAALVEAIAGKPPADAANAKKRDDYAQNIAAITDFLERIYHSLRNLGITPQERAINYSVTNALTVAGIFEAALKAKMELDTIEVERSPICRPDSECWDVVLSFFDPENVLRSRKCYRFTVDVSDVCPVMVGKVRSWSIR